MSFLRVVRKRNLTGVFGSGLACVVIAIMDATHGHPVGAAIFGIVGGVNIGVTLAEWRFR